MVNVVAPIVGASVMAGAFVGLMLMGLFRSGHSTQQLRWAFGLWFTLAWAVGFGAIANNQGYYTRASSDGVIALWAIPTLWTITLPFACAILTCGLYKSLGARIGPPLLLFASMLCLALGVFQPYGWADWFWWMCAAILWVLLVLYMLCVDRLEVIHDAVKNKNPRSLVVDWIGLVWRALPGVAAVLLHHVVPRRVVPRHDHDLHHLADRLHGVHTRVGGLLCFLLRSIKAIPYVPMEEIAVGTGSLIGSDVGSTGTAETAKQRKNAHGENNPGYTVFPINGH